MGIRKFKEEDIDSVMSIWLRATVAAHPFISEFYWRCNYNTVKKEYIPKSETYIYEENKSIKGFISIIEGNYIGALFIEPSSQNRGIGKRLLEYVKGNYESLTLSVYKDNKKAYNFYEKASFKAVKEMKNTSRGFLEVLMKLESE